MVINHVRRLRPAVHSVGVPTFFGDRIFPSLARRLARWALGFNHTSRDRVGAGEGGEGGEDRRGEDRSGQARPGQRALNDTQPLSDTQHLNISRPPTTYACLPACILRRWPV